MSFEEQTDFASQVADLNKYGQTLNRCESVEEVVSLTLEGISLLFETAHSTFVEVRDGDLRVVHSTNPALSPGSEPSDVTVRAFDAGETFDDAHVRPIEILASHAATASATSGRASASSGPTATSRRARS